MTDIIYAEFFINECKFTVEDYDTDRYGIYNEDMFVGTCSSPTQDSAIPVAVEYYKKCHI